ncbi:DUF4328 domain-containing protein [Streptomyces sp. NBC_00335]|uniref:DUF4328 domain-containing protein n=1 Tax=unclassified Streptomyces TaxID=2593676 RepID=UPI00224EBD09|nr:MULTISPECIES: DUF4328 domain-containing protein [unclassified Streptomyces]MCX5408994.1 DUF4328 domain-containing protein [Streptomyces sp. NBC_00086]
MSFSATGSPPPVDPDQRTPPRVPSPQAAPPEPLARLRPPGGLATATTVLLALFVLYALLLTGTGLYLGSALRAGSYPGAGTADAGTLPDTLMALAGLVEIPLLITTAVLFVSWFHRVHHNALILGRDAVTRSPAWAIGGWFVPFAFLRIPYKMAKEIWAASLLRGPDGAHRPVSTAPVTSWWLVWITALLANRAYDTLHGRATDADGLATAATVAAGYGVVLLAASVLAIRFVRGLTAMQIAKAAQAQATYAAP